jgi:nucleoid-associated protein YgaU
MTLTDLNGPMSLQPRGPGLGRISRPTRFAGLAILLLSFATFGAAVTHAQDQQDQSVAEAARQERARKQELQRHGKHVYTQEDLKHPNILTPEDRAQVEAKRNECAQKNNCSPAPSQNSPAVLDANSQHQQPSLGEVARQLRKQKELQALKPKQSEPFHLSLGTPELASPILPERETIRPPSQPAMHLKMPSNVFRRDPFSAVPLHPPIAANARPEPPAGAREITDSTPSAIIHAGARENFRVSFRPNVRRETPQRVGSDPLAKVTPDFYKDVRPNFRPRARVIVPALPRIFFRPAPPRILAQPARPQLIAPSDTVRPVQPQRSLPATTDGAQKRVSVQRGDSLWKLAKQNLGYGNRWPELLAANRGITDPNQIRAGAQLYLPEAAAKTSSKAAAANVAKQTLKVHKGDTLWSLARAKFGRSSAWPCLATANPAVSDPNRINVNQELVVPASCSP